LFTKIPELTEKEPLTVSLIRKVIPKLDLPGFSLFAPAAIMFLLALQFGSDEKFSWSSSTIIGLFVGAGVTAILFILWERRVGQQAMIPGNIIKQRIVWSSAGFGSCLMTGLNVAAYYLPIYFQAVKGVGPTMSGVDMLPSILSQLFAVISSGAAGKSSHLQIVQYGARLTMG
jgi:hypothetical protein